MALTLVTSDLIGGLDYSKLTGTVPTWNQNTSGTAAGLSATLAVGSGGTGVTSITALKNVLDDETWTFANNITATGTLTVNGTGNSAFNGDLYIVGKKLDISAPSGGNAYVKFSDTNSSAKNWRVGTSLSARGVFNIYNETDDNLAFNILADGKVGIGITSPSWKLAVSDGTITGFINPLNSYFNIGAATSHGLKLYAGGDARITVSSDGRVGVGITDPSTYDGESDDLVVASGVDGSVPTPGITIACLGDTKATGRGALRFSDGTSGTQRYIGGVEYNHNGDAMSFRTAGVQRLTIDSSGNATFGGAVAISGASSFPVSDVSALNPGIQIPTNVQLGFGNGASSKPDFGFAVQGTAGNARLNIFCGTGGTAVDAFIDTNGFIHAPAFFVGGESSVNALDAYEEGTWTPAVSTTGGSVSDAITPTGQYTIIGRQVIVSFQFRCSSSSGGSGTLKITNLPVAFAKS